MRTFATNNRADYAGAAAQVLDGLNERAASVEFEAAHLCAASYYARTTDRPREYAGCTSSNAVGIATG